MPYIPLNRRVSAGYEPETPGELNYAICNLVLEYLRRQGLCYDTINEVMGAVECSKLELYRRLAVPYEDKAKERNGDLDWSIE